MSRRALDRFMNRLLTAPTVSRRLLALVKKCYEIGNGFSGHNNNVQYYEQGGWKLVNIAKLFPKQLWDVKPFNESARDWIAPVLDIYSMSDLALHSKVEAAEHRRVVTLKVSYHSSSYDDPRYCKDIFQMVLVRKAKAV